MDRRRATRLLTSLFLAASALWSVSAQELTLPNVPNSLKFMAMGDTGSGDREQFDVANQMARFHAKYRCRCAVPPVQTGTDRRGAHCHAQPI